MIISTNNEAANTVIKLLNVQINIFVQERNRLLLLLGASLPGDKAVWDVLTPDIREVVKQDMKTNIFNSQRNIDEVLNQIGPL